METNVTIVGNAIGPVITRGGGDRLVSSLRVAANERYRDPATGEWTNGATLFIDVSCFGRLGEHVRTVVMKGDPVIVQGKLRTRDFEVDGKRRSVTEVKATAVGLNLARTDVVVRRRLPEEAAQPAVTAETAGAAEAPADNPWETLDGSATDEILEEVAATM